MDATMTKNETRFVNTPMESDLIEKLDTMVTKKESTRAQFIRLLVREAWEEFEHMETLKTRVQPKIKAVAK